MPEQDEREKAIERGIVQFRADESFMRALFTASDELHIPPGVIARSWVSDQLTHFDDLELIKKQDDFAYREVRKFLGKSTELIQQLLHLYDVLQELFNANPASLNAHQVIGLLHCLQGSRYQMLMGNLCCLRSHPIDQASYRRKSIEFCAFAIKMLRSPDHAQTWVNAISYRAYEKYESEFSIMSCISQAEDLMGPRLKKMYNTLSQQVHASPFSIATQIRVENQSHLLDFFQHQTDSKRQFLAMTFLSGIEGDGLIIKAYGAAISQISTNFQQQRWDYEVQKFDALRNQIKDFWAPVLDPDRRFREARPRPKIKPAKRKSESDSNGATS
jgi:hypothetical protein